MKWFVDVVLLSLLSLVLAVALYRFLPACRSTFNVMSKKYGSEIFTLTRTLAVAEDVHFFHTNRLGIIPMIHG